MTDRAARPPNAVQAERVDTDESLKDEREKTDAELARRNSTVHRAADAVLETARSRANERLNVARERGDAALEEANAPASVIETVAEERASEDDVLATERLAAAKKLELERLARQRALTELLRLERDETDKWLELERARVDEVVASRDDFLAMVSHDLRNLLGGIALSAGTLVRHTAEEATRVEANRIQRFSARMNRLVGDLVDIVSIDAGKLAMAVQAQDAAALLRDIVDTFQAAAADKGISLGVDAPATLSGQLDPQRVQQVLANLVGNALKFTPRGGRVELSARACSEVAGGFIEISVLDDGVGIPADKADKIFERFWQSAKNDQRGLGLGLYISRCVVEAHGGRIWFEPRATGGSAFRFTLPVSAPASPGAGAE